MSNSLTVELPFAPHAHQRAAHALRLVHRFLVLVWHRRAGKTVFAVVELILAALACTRPMGRYGYIGPFLGQAKEIAWAYLEMFTRVIPGRVVNLSDLSITFPNGARIRIYGADNPDAIRGLYFDGVILDEVAQMKPEVWGEIVRPMLTDRLGWAMFIGTPKGVNLFSKVYFASLRGGEEDEWHGDMRRVGDTGMISDAELASARRDMSPQEYAQEFECDFEAAQTSNLLGLSDVLAAQKRTYGMAEYHQMPRILGVDLAREGDDRSCIFPRQGLVAYKPRVLRERDSMALAGIVGEAIERFEPDAVFLDKGGLGGPILDRLHQLGYHQVQGIDFGGKPLSPRFENRRTEMWWKMAEWVKDGGALPESEELVADLTAPTYSFANDKGKVSLERKKDMKKRGLPSPDVGDGLALTFAEPVPIRTEIERARQRHGGRREYVPYAEGRS